MAIYCCPKCGAWNSCVTKWVRTEKGEENICCSTCNFYKECLRKDIEGLLQERSDKLLWIREQLEEAINPTVTNVSLHGLDLRDFKAFVANYALTGFWILFGLETKLLQQSILYTLSIIPCLVVFWIILRKVQKISTRAKA
ncbi:MAG: hypothetical protein NC920_04840 [Candidatus Omnitrophica bacterium]|nr:hypothetical protein [Candidatus Omnitrophota bacterium]MCM8798995.1 hypothetical protein [Candidatus Omnitrophota bacterium]